MAKKKFKCDDRYLRFDNWPQVTVEEIEMKRMAEEFWVITMAEELLSDLKTRERSKKIGWSFSKYTRVRRQCMEPVGHGKSGKWQIKTIPKTDCGG